MMNINHLRYFTIVVKRKSFRKAAEELNVSQPALSNSLKKLEETLGVELLERSPQGVFPTDYGETLFRFATAAIDSVNRGTQEIDLLRQGTKGHIKIGAPGGMIEQIVPKIIARISETKPEYTYTVQFGFLHKLIDDMAEGQLDFLVTSYWPSSSLLENLEVQHLADLELSVYGRSDHPLLSKSDLRFEEMINADWIFLDSPTMKEFTKIFLGTAQRNRVNQPIFSNSIPFICEMIQHMDLLSIFPDAFVAHLVDENRIAKLDYPMIAQKIAAGLIYNAERTQTRAMIEFANAAREVIKQEL